MVIRATQLSSQTKEMLERRHCSLVLIIIGFAAVIFLMKLNMQILLSLQKSKYSGPFDPDVFIVTFNSYSNDKPTNLYSKSSFNRRKIYPWKKKDPTCQHLSVQVCSIVHLEIIEGIP